MLRRLLSMCVVLASLDIAVHSAGARTPVQALAEHLMSNYSAIGRPVYNEDDVVEVKVGLALRNLDSVDQVTQVVSTNVWLRMYWKDPRLSWSLQQWPGIKKINLPTSGATRVWYPDILLYNTGENPLSGLHFTDVSVSSDGSVFWSRPGLMRSTFRPQLKDFPFDSQNISWKFGSWTHDAAEMKLTIHNGGTDTGSLVTNLEWEVKGTAAVIHTMEYSCCPDPYEDVEFSLVLQRHPEFYLQESVFPGILLVICSWSSFWMNRENGIGARTAVVMTSLLAQITLRVVAAGKIPIASEQTWLEKFQTMLLCFNAFALVAWVFVMWLCKSRWQRHRWEPASQHDWDPPKWLQPTMTHYADIISDIRNEEHKERTGMLTWAVASWRINAIHGGGHLPLELEAIGVNIHINAANPLAGHCRHNETETFLGAKPKQEGIEVVQPSKLRILTQCRDTLEMFLHSKSVQECLRKERLQKRITDRRRVYGKSAAQMDGPGPILAKYVDHTLRVLYLFVFMCCAIVLANWDG